MAGDVLPEDVRRRERHPEEGGGAPVDGEGAREEGDPGNHERERARAEPEEERVRHQQLDGTWEPVAGGRQ